ncbi:FlhB domain-containing protein [Campylobacter insulaenigrae]|uniref:YdcH family protein n=1 Tax=Campylobacter insulaenigrae TaxID=260714 RepID=UPI000F6BDEA4|nr:YdcH family protein [Campylobacter insulaenigrae]MCR6590908.1 YdcH family protein [Campylobacter insulaenigrae]MCR6592585.1 YdcH family protein [Campylobacter insulaenigrae]VEJ54178.1 FlhB domain-containing protein [Campylobacter insulaenigrae]
MLHEFRDLITQLKGKDKHFDKLFDEHNELDHKIKDAEEGRIHLDNLEITNLKKEKLKLKDELNTYLSNYQK